VLATVLGAIDLGLRIILVTDAIRQELEKFFQATDELEDKNLNIIGCKAAVQAIKDASKSYKKNGA
jgi:inorganic pyrophosphatase